MKTIRFKGHVDEHHRLVAQAPSSVPPGPVDVMVTVQSAGDEDEAGVAWSDGVAQEWAEELSDSRQDLYTLGDGEPVNDGR